jgi:hypothetical protein
MPGAMPACAYLSLLGAFRPTFRRSRVAFLHNFRNPRKISAHEGLRRR